MHLVFKLLPSFKLTTSTSPECYSVQTLSETRVLPSHVSLVYDVDIHLEVSGYLFC